MDSRPHFRPCGAGHIKQPQLRSHSVGLRDDQIVCACKTTAAVYAVFSLVRLPVLPVKLLQFLSISGVSQLPSMLSLDVSPLCGRPKENYKNQRTLKCACPMADTIELPASVQIVFSVKRRQSTR